MNFRRNRRSTSKNNSCLGPKNNFTGTSRANWPTRKSQRFPTTRMRGQRSRHQRRRISMKARMRRTRLRTNMLNLMTYRRFFLHFERIGKRTLTLNRNNGPRSRRPDKLSPSIPTRSTMTELLISSVSNARTIKRRRRHRRHRHRKGFMTGKLNHDPRPPRREMLIIKKVTHRRRTGQNGTKRNGPRGGASPGINGSRVLTGKRSSMKRRSQGSRSNQPRNGRGKINLNKNSIFFRRRLGSINNNLRNS